MQTGVPVYISLGPRPHPYTRGGWVWERDYCTLVCPPEILGVVNTCACVNIRYVYACAEGPVDSGRDSLYHHHHHHHYYNNVTVVHLSIATEGHQKRLDLESSYAVSLATER